MNTGIATVTSTETPMGTSEVKLCSKCGKPGEFYTRPNGRFRSTCKKCERISASAYMRAKYKTPEGRAAKRSYRLVHKDTIVLSARYSARQRLLAFDKLKSAPCMDCGQSFPPYVMDFDHRDPSVKRFEISRVKSSTLRWSTILAEVAKCDLVCARCHRLRTWVPPKKKTKGNRLLKNRLKNVPCVDCAGTFHYCQMEFDHVRGTKVAPVASLGTLASIQEEADKCEVVCTNCHRIRTHNKKQGFQRVASSPVAVQVYGRLRGTPSFVADQMKTKATETTHV